jgi:hypothetical protein
MKPTDLVTDGRHRHVADAAITPRHREQFITAARRRALMQEATAA